MKLFSSKQVHTGWNFKSESATLQTDSLDYAKAIKSVLEMHNDSLDSEAVSLGAKFFSIKASSHGGIITLVITGDMKALEVYLKNNQSILASDPRCDIPSDLSEKSRLLVK